MKFLLSSQTDQEIMELLWQNKQWISGVDFWEYFINHGKICKRQTINTYLTRLEERGLLVKDDKKYMYRYTKEEFEANKAQEFLNTMYGGSLKKLVVALTGSKKINSEDADDLRNYLDNLD